MLTALLLYSMVAGGTCDNVRNLNLPNTTITLAQQVPPGGFTPQGGRGAEAFKNLPAFCRVAATLSFQFTNLLNHFQAAGPSSLALTSPTTFGRITASAISGTATLGNTPRNVEFGLRIHF